MKKSLIIISVILLCGCYSNPPKFKSGLEGEAMPVIELVAADSSTLFNTKDIPIGKPTVLFAFEPWCPYCRAQTRSIISHIESLENINIYMLCNSQYPEFKRFYDKYQLNKYPNIKAGIDYTHSFVKYFKSASVPYLAVYNTDKKLKQVLIGKNYISTIKRTALE